MEHIIINNDVFVRMRKALGPEWTKKTTAEFGVDAVNFSKERFRQKNWKGQVSEPWKPRKRTDRGSLMARTGRLKRSIKKLSSGVDYVIIGTDVSYARIHNEGGKISKTVRVRKHTRRPSKSNKERESSIIKVKAHSRKMRLNISKRQFMGKSRALEIRLQYRLKKNVDNKLNTVFK